MFTELISASFMCVLSLILHPSQQDIYIDNFPSAPSSDQTKIRDEELKLSNDGRLKGLLWRLERFKGHYLKYLRHPLRDISGRISRHVRNAGFCPGKEYKAVFVAAHNLSW